MLTKRERRIILFGKRQKSVYILNDEITSSVNNIKNIQEKSDINSKDFKAVISLTSYRKRINSVHKTIISLVKNCKGFHIVLVLSEEEFPQKEKELPNTLIELYNTGCFEILWVYKNYRALKKVIFTIDKYRDFPVISADDDLIYKTNYADVLYKTWIKNQDSFVTYRKSTDHRTKHTETWGFATLHPPYCYYDVAIKALDMIDFSNDLFMNDDLFYSVLRELLSKEKIISMQKSLNEICASSSTAEGVTKKSNKLGKKVKEYEEYKKIIEKILKDAE